MMLRQLREVQNLSNHLQALNTISIHTMMDMQMVELDDTAHIMHDDIDGNIMVS